MERSSDIVKISSLTNTFITKYYMEGSLSSLPYFVGEELDGVVDMDNLDTSACMICSTYNPYLETHDNPFMFLKSHYWTNSLVT